ncbi:ExeA family protein [Lysobacter sp. CA199]|uniref:ExeA family protein n=1 Tax=Lysobacter sp. CA199 TaxID=3455608 RepID=UPI003F8D4ED8
MTLRLKSILADAAIKQGALAKAVGLSRPALNALINHNQLPRGLARDSVDRLITQYLKNHGADYGRWNEEEPPCANTAAPDSPQLTTTDEEEQMLLRKHSLTPQARRHFQLAGDPFADPVTAEEVFLSSDIRYVRESVYQTARHGGFIAVVGESGSGKSTLREELTDRIHREEVPIILIEPYVLAMESNDQVGKTLKSQHIAESIMAGVSPLTKLKNSPEQRFKQLHEALRDSARAGHSHALLIEEAHALPLATLKHLKRFRELKDGLRPLLSVILIGQPELGAKLSEHNPEVREVVQRIEVITMQPLDSELENYLSFRFKRLGMPLNKIIETAAIEALRKKLTPARGVGSLLYPQAIHNALAAAMNRAADLGAPVVSKQLVEAA